HAPPITDHSYTPTQGGSDNTSLKVTPDFGARSSEAAACGAATACLALTKSSNLRPDALESTSPGVQQAESRSARPPFDLRRVSAQAGFRPRRRRVVGVLVYLQVTGRGATWLAYPRYGNAPNPSCRARRTL